MYFGRVPHTHDDDEGANACRMESIYILHMYMCDRKPVVWSLKNISALEFELRIDLFK